VAGASFSVAFDGGPTVKANVVSPPAESALWTAMFKRDLRVDPHPFQTPAIPAVVSHPVGHVMEFLKSQYVSIGQLSPTAHPNVHLLLGTAAGAAGLAESGGGDTIAGQTAESSGHLASYVTAQDSPVRIAAGPAQNFLSRPAGSVTFQHLLVNPFQVQALQQQLTHSLQQNRYIPHRAAMNPPLDFLQLQMFHAPTGLTSALYHQPVTAPTVDFHQAVSSLGDYPDLMRRLGLVIDLEVPVEAMPPGASNVRVIPQWGAPPDFSDYSPPTAYILDTQRFAAAPKPPAAGAEGSGIQVTDGLLDLSDPDQYRVVEVDVDGAALKTAHLARQLERRVTTSVKQAALPLKSRALVERAVLSSGALTGSNDSAPAVTAPDPGTETLPGLRSTGLSLVKAERARHLVNRLQFAAAQNERLQALLKQQPPPGGEQPFYAEDLVRGYRIDVWDSISKAWHSLCKRKGAYTFPAGTATWDHSDEGFISIGATRKPDDPNLYLHESLFRWTGWSLCAPRPGEAIDPDSHHRNIENTPATPLGLSVRFAAEPGTLPTLRFGASYRFRARAADLAGNGLLLTEVPTDQDKRATAAAVYSRFDPVTSPSLVLTQDTGASPAESLERLVIRSNYDTPAAAYQTPSSPTSARHVAPSPTSQLLAEEKGVFDTHGRPDPAAYALIQGKEGNYRAVEPGASLGMPYLPDPMAAGVAFVGLPGTPPGTVHQVSFWPAGSKWPEAKPFRLQIVESAAPAAPAPQWDEGARVLTVSIPKGETAAVQMSSFLTQPDLELMGIWKWLNEGGPAGGAMLQDALAGRQWMQTPFRTIYLVHALQQPLKAPQIQSMTPARTIGGNAAALAMKVDVSFTSTAKLDIMADWTEPVDDPTAPAPSTVA
ncbi:MAG: hypothetical protein LC772_09505, partial [Chloroflexi bacterium]|nr:hypothetical protein [Chloroflexota bacterium]